MTNGSAIPAIGSSWSAVQREARCPETIGHSARWEEMKIAAIGGFVARTTFAHLAILSSPLSASAAQSVPPSDPDLVYAVVDGQPLRNNLHRANPAPALPTPLVLWRHGGGWQSGGRTRMPSFALPLLQADISVATLD